MYAWATSHRDEPAAVRISIVIPTQRRPAALATAVRSALTQTGVDAAEVELIVADNDAIDSARAAVEAFAAKAPFAVRYVHEPAAGVANVRNAALAVARGELIAFLDDDEEAPPQWLARLCAAQIAYDADVVFGPVLGRAPPHLATHRAYLEHFFSRHGPNESGVIDFYYGCGNSLLRRAALPDPDRPFDPARNQIGGEDDRLFAQMKVGGARFAWAADAPVWEDPAADRLSLNYALSRAFAFGQGGSVKRVSPPHRDWAGLAFSMATGAAQAVVFGAVSGLKWAARDPDRAFWFDRAVRGAGKVLWWKAFHRQFYGMSAPATSAEAAPARATPAQPDRLTLA